MPTNIFDLPELIDGDLSEKLLSHEVQIIDRAESLMAQGDDSLRIHRDAWELTNELMWAHQTDHPADESLHFAAENLKLFHLQILATRTKFPLPA